MERKKKNGHRLLTARKVQPTTTPEKGASDIETKYQAAVDLIDVEGWIGRLGEEAAELAAAVSKYQRVKNRTFPCGMSLDDAWQDLLAEMADVELALKAIRKKMANTSATPKLDACVEQKKTKLIKQVNKACSVGMRQIHRPALMVFPWYPSMDPNNPMRDAVAEDLTD